VRKLKNSKFSYIEKNESLETISNSDFENCLKKCKIDLSIKQYKCFTRRKFLTLIDFSENLKSKSYKFCDKSLQIDQTFLENSLTCHKNCIDKCNSL
jgi:hypothetical protein